MWRACVECPPVRAGGFCFAGLIPAMVKKPGSFSGEKIDMGASGASARRGLSSFKAMSSSSGGRRPSLYFTGAGSQPACDHGAIDPIVITAHITGSPVPRKSLGDLARDPLRRRVGCDVDPDEISVIPCTVQPSVLVQGS